MSARREPFATRLLGWHASAGRHELPWQRDRTPYRVWVSEIMLQQTQVATVIPYFERFMQRFAQIRALAEAPQDEVLHLWTGLGYYARARNLHRAAQIMVERFHGAFPATLEEAMELPGIGRSTAGAILAISCGQRHAILDGNVKRVLARHAGIDGPIDDAATLAQLWQLADRYTPADGVATYTQAIMDLGATVCTRTRPRCDACPMAADCRARIEARQRELPAAKRRRAARPRRHAVMLVARHASTVLLVRRPPAGVWGGLWCLPEFAAREAAERFAREHLPDAALADEPLAPIEHRFTHFDLMITPLIARCRRAGGVNDGGELWYDLARPSRVGLPAPIKTLLGNLPERNEP